MDRYDIVVEPERQHQQAIAFCEANGLDARKIPAEDGLRIVAVGDAEWEIRYREWDDARLTLGPWQSVPMLSYPEAHGLSTRTVVALEDIKRQLEAAGCEHALAVELAPVVQGIIATEVAS